jgi:hypothetical protein
MSSEHNLDAPPAGKVWKLFFFLNDLSLRFTRSFMLLIEAAGLGEGDGLVEALREG